ncbi:MAG: hypothetical protein A2266_09245 [Bacteroidetes bacterium RIFOXYA12_FULL_40_10]|nr:MAG: hypothetical protein A2266_09245 [Bacteroidetes bacterium RIFOXYA12_FULL_40_10]
MITNSIESSKTYICQLLQTVWDTEIIKDNRKNKKDFLKESEYFKIIDSKEKYNALDMSFIPEIIFIVPELNWSNDDVNEGYDIARDLITKKYKSDFIQILFLSVLERATLKDVSDVRNKSFVEAFPHACLLDSKLGIQFSYYSEIHYKLIKHLAISDEGRLQKIGHEMNSVKANILRETREIGLNRTDLITNLEELSLFQQWTGIRITEEIEKAKNATANKQLVSVSKTTENIIDEISLNISSKGVINEMQARDKFKYKVFIFEDDKEYRKFFSETFSNFYTEVYPDKNDSFPVNTTTKDFTISEAEDIIKTTGKRFNIFLLDLLYKDDAGNWLNFNGLDLYRLVKSVNPYAVRLIITSLPRGIVAKLAEVITSDTEKPNIDQVYTKKYGFDYLKDTIIESIERINEECKVKEESKSMWMPFPIKGIFGGQMIPTLLFELFYHNSGEYHIMVNRALGFYDYFLREQSLKANTFWNGELISPRQKNKISSEEFLKRLPIILTYRLLALQFFSKTDNKIIIPISTWREILNNISNLRPDDFTKDFNTKLGMHVERNVSKKLTTQITYQIQAKNLFPHEIEFIRSIKFNYEDFFTNNSLNEEQSSLFKEFIIKGGMILYESWNELLLDYNPYKGYENLIENEAKVINIDNEILNYKNFIGFLRSIFANFNIDPDGFRLIISDIISSNVQEIFESDDLIYDLYDDLLGVLKSNSSISKER